MRAGEIVGSSGPLRLLLSGAAILVVCTLLARVVNRVTARGARRDTASGDKPLGDAGAFELIRKDRYLLWIALLTVLLNVVNTSGEYLFGRYVVEQASAIHGSEPEFAEARQQFIGETYSRLFSTVNLLGFLLQMFVVSRLFKYLGVGKSLFIHPVVALTGYALMIRAPSMQLIAGLKVVDNSIDYSLGNTTKQALWLPTSREAKYKAKQAVDSFFMRAGDVVQAGIVFLAERLAVGVPALAAVNVGLAGAWIGVAALLNVSLRRKAEQAHSSEL
jgi:AAA family ATP:ADP antiporter